LLQSGQSGGLLGLSHCGLSLRLFKTALRQHTVGYRRQAALHPARNESSQALMGLDVFLEGQCLLLAGFPLAPGCDEKWLRKFEQVR
jgi:hypothetical protein